MFSLERLHSAALIENGISELNTRMFSPTYERIGFVGINAFAFGTDLCRFDCNGNVGVIYLDITTKVLTQSFYCAFGKVRSVVYKG